MPDQERLYRDGTSQAQRLTEALKESYIAIEERTIADWLRFAQKYGKELHYYNFENQKAGDWSGFLDGDIEDMLAYLERPESFGNQPAKLQWLSRPHFVLFLVFLKLLDEHYKGAINQLLPRHLDYYYREILQFQQKKATPDQVYLYAELSKKYAKDRYLLKKNTPLFADKDATGKDLVYLTDEDIMLNKAQLVAIKSLFVDKDIKTLESYESPTGILAMLQLVMGTKSEEDPSVKPGGVLPKVDFLATATTPDKEFLVPTLVTFLNFVQDKMKLSFAGFRQLMKLKNKVDENEEDWTEINEVLAGMKNEVVVNGKRFVENFNTATSINPVDDNAFNELQNVKNVYDLHEELNFATTGQYDNFSTDEQTLPPDYHNPVRVRVLQKFIYDNFYKKETEEAINPFTETPTQLAQVNNFQKMMETRVAIREDWFAMRALLSSISEPNNVVKLNRDEAVEHPEEYPIFNDLIESKYGAGNINFKEAHNSISTIDDYFDNLEKIEAYFSLKAEEIQFLLTAPENDQKRVREILRKIYTKKSNNSSIRPEKIDLQGLYAFEDAKTAKIDTSDAWKTFGRVQTGHLANTGIAIRSSLLHLSEGTRTITVALILAGNEERKSALSKLSKDITDDIPSHPFQVELSTEKEWLVVEDFTQLTFDEANNTLTIAFKLNPDIDPISKMEDSPYGSLPVLRITLARPEQLFDQMTAYDLFSQLEIEKVGLTVQVDGLIPSAIRNDDVLLNAEEAFLPFGANPKVGSSLYFTHPELIEKRLDSIQLKFDWLGDPNWNELYKNYSTVVADRKTFANFKANLQLTDQGFTRKFVIQDEEEFKEISIELFKENTDASILKEMEKSEEYIPPFVYSNLEHQDFSDEVFQNKRYFILKLNPLDFGHSEYPKLAAQKATLLAVHAAKNKVNEEDNFYTVNPPYTPESKSLKITYTAKANNLGAADSDQGAELLHLHPFGYRVITAKDTTYFLPPYQQEGYLYLGLKDLNPPIDLSLLFQMAAGSANPDVVPPFIIWEYLVGDNWQRFNGQNRIIADGTNGFLNSGIVRLRIPAAADTVHHILPTGFYWLRANVRENTSGVTNIIDIHTQAFSATFEDRGNDAEHLSTPLSPNNIKRLLRPQPAIKKIIQPYPSFGGRPIEPLSQLNTRISERLRHKQRALTTWDYERLVLEDFPQVYKVKAIAGEQLKDNQLGQLTLIVIPNIKDIRLFDSFEPKLPLNTLQAIQQYLAPIAPPQANIVVKNPTYLQLIIRMTVVLYPAYQADAIFYLNRLEQALLEYLAPWAYDTKADIAIGGKIYPSLIVDYVERLEYIDYISNFRIIYGSGDNFRPATTEEMQIGLVAPQADAIWVSAKQHRLRTNTNNEAGIGYMIVERDFEIA